MKRYSASKSYTDLRHTRSLCYGAAEEEDERLLGWVDEWSGSQSDEEYANDIADEVVDNLVKKHPNLFVVKTPSESSVVTQVTRAWLNHGSHPHYHDSMQRMLRREWPILANALDQLADHELSK